MPFTKQKHSRPHRIMRLHNLTKIIKLCSSPKLNYAKLWNCSKLLKEVELYSPAWLEILNWGTNASCWPYWGSSPISEWRNWTRPRWCWGTRSQDLRITAAVQRSEGWDFPRRCWTKPCTFRSRWSPWWLGSCSSSGSGRTAEPKSFPHRPRTRIEEEWTVDVQNLEDEQTGRQLDDLTGKHWRIVEIVRGFVVVALGFDEVKPEDDMYGEPRDLRHRILLITIAQVIVQALIERAQILEMI